MSATITNTLLNIDGTPKVGVSVVITFVPTNNEGSFDPASAAEVLPSTVSLTTDSAGKWSATLKSNGDFVFNDSYYRVDEYITNTLINSYTFIVPLGGGTYFLRDVLAQPTVSATPYSTSLLTTDQAAAQYINKTTKPSVTGSKGGNAALTSLINQLAALGIITNNTT